MANYKVTLFKNTGLNGVNTVDNVSVLNKAPHFTVPDVELMQDRNLRYINVEATFSQCEDCDYCIVGSECYSIPDGGINAKTEAVTEITLLSDPFLSAGGITVSSSGDVTARFDILDGVTQRCTVKDDSWGAYTADDPLTAPQEPLQLQTEWLSPSGGTIPSTISGDPILIESTVDLSSQAFNQTGDTYTDNETGETATVPRTIPIKTKDTDHTTSFNIDGAKKSNGTEIFCRNDSGKASDGASEAGVVVDKGLSVVRQLGIESGSIISQYRLPKEFCGGITVTYPFATGADGADTGQRITLITNVSGSMSSSISPDYASVKNKRVLYGDYNKYGLMTCAGNSAEFNPEDLGGEKAPSISYKSDPRPKGKPYYRFATINGNSDFWRNSIAGSEWENVPLIYQGESGSALTRLNFDNERAMKSLQADQFEKNYGLTLVNHVTQGVKDTAAAGFAGAATGGAPGAIAGVAGAGIAAGVDIAQSIMSHDQYFDQYNQEKANELSGLYQSTTIYAPTVNFPYNADILRDIKGNGVLVYKYHMSANDTKRVDKLLTMYGYMSAEPLTLANFGRRKHFDYVACSTISITGLPKWRCNAIAQQLKVGIRIWHELPNKKAYDDNPVRS